MEKLKEISNIAIWYLAMIVIIFIAIAVVIIPCMAIFYPMDLYYCSAKAVGFEDWSYHFFAGCFVEIDGRMIPIENVRIEK